MSAELDALGTVASQPRIADPPKLEPGRTLHLWWCREEQVTDDATLARYAGLLTDEERARHKRFLRAADRHRFLVTRALVRTTLSRYASVPPEAWRFGKNEYGRPYAENDAWPAGLHFNLSHTAGMVVCGVSEHHAMGVDVEPLARRVEIEGVARHSFAASEVGAMMALPKDARRGRFMRYWTLKESYIKGRSMGLSLPLKRFAFTLDGAAPPRIAFEPPLDDDPARWRFASLRLDPDHLVAVAVASDDGPPALAIEAREIVP